MNTRRPFTLIAAAIFTIMALGHIYRLTSGLDITIGGGAVPLSMSWFGLVITGVLAVMLYRESQK